MNIKRIIALLLALITIFVMVGCGKARRPIVKLTLASEDAEAILAAAGITLPDVEEITCQGTTVIWYSWADRFHNYSEEEVVNSGYWVFTEKYGCEIEWRECLWANRFTDLANYIAASNSPDFYALSMEIFPNYVMKGMFQAVNDYVDYDDPLWAGTAEIARNHLSLGDNVYGFVTEVRPEKPFVYNRRVMEEYGYEDPAELYYNGEWTWDVFLDMCIDFSDADIERYAVDGWWYDLAIFESTGVDVVMYDTETEEYYENIDDPRLERAASVLEELSKNDCIYPVWAKGWKSRGTSLEGDGLKDGLTLFWCVTATVVFTKPVSEMALAWGDMEAEEVMFVPAPRDPNGDGQHYVTASPSGYALIQGAKNPEGVGLIAACDRFKLLDPTVTAYDKRELMNKYLWTAEMFEMKQELANLVNNGGAMVPAGTTSDTISTISGRLKQMVRTSEPSSWAQLKETYSEQLKYYVEEFNLDLDDYEASLGA